MLAPYTIAHLKLALRLRDEGLPSESAQILLTDTLDHEPPQLSLQLMEDPVAAEGRRASELKQKERFTVVIGNPPYNREQRAEGDTGRRKGGVVRHGAAGFEPLIKDLTKPMTDAGLGLHIKNLYNDYVYFWRWAVWQATQLPPGPGIVIFITASSLLDGISMAGVRSLLREAFDELLIVDLGGEGRGALIEENVFEIRTPVAIALGVKTGINSTSGTARYIRLSGDRASKYEQLEHMSLSHESIPIPGDGLDLLIPRSRAAYWAWPSLTHLLPWSYSGAQFKRTWPIGSTRAVLNQRWKNLVSQVPRDRAALLKETGFRTTRTTPLPLLGTTRRLAPISNLDRNDNPEGLKPYGFRSFDRQWVIADNRVADRPRPHLWAVRSKKQLYLTTLTATRLGHGPVVTVTPYVPDMSHFRGSFGAKDVLPVFRDRATRKMNLTQSLLEVLHHRIKRAINVEDLVAYLHALLGTSAFSDRFADELAEMAGPVHIPMTSNPDLFGRAVALGRELLWYHTWGERFQPAGNPNLPEGSTLQLSAIHGYPDKFRYIPVKQILEVGTGRFGPVSQEVWDFEVSGLKVLHSWLGYRMAKGKGRKSSPLDDIRPARWVFTEEMLRVITILQHTIDVTPAAAQLLEEIVTGPLIPAADLPTPTEAERKPPKS